MVLRAVNEEGTWPGLANGLAPPAGVWVLGLVPLAASLNFGLLKSHLYSTLHLGAPHPLPRFWIV